MTTNDAPSRHTVIPLHDESEPGLTRRAALQWMAASLALAGGACTKAPDERLYPYVNMPEAGRGGLPAYYASAFVRDGHALGVLVGTREGRPIKIEGNPAHPSSLGSTDVFAQASILELWDPDRSQVVHQRLADAAGGSRDEPASAPSTWPAFEAAWRARAATLEARRGRGLAVLTPRFTSPTQAAQLQALLQRFPEARWHRHAPLMPIAARAGATRAFGRECDWLLHLDRARVIVALGADPFSDEAGRVRQARDWASRRAGLASEGAPAGEEARTFAIETTPGLFGARADERVALAPAAIESLVDEMASLLAAGAPAGAPAGEPSSLAARLVSALRRGGNASLLVAGRSLSPRAHAQVARMHRQLGSIGTTLDAIEPLDRIEGAEPGSLAALVETIETGAVDTLLVVGGNPAYDTPGDVGFVAALRRVPFSAHLGLHRDETARLAGWHLPASHDYESWGDARGHDGTLTLMQPTILPLYDTRSPIEWLAMLAGSDTRDGHDLVRARFLAADAAGSSDAKASPASSPADAANERWRQAVRAGFVAGSAAAPLVLPEAIVETASAKVAPAAAATPIRATTLEAVFVADPSIDAGAYANNGWLQELPHPLTKITWGNAIQIGPKSAAALGLLDDDVVRLAAGERFVEGPVRVLAEHAEGAVTLALGHGRRAAGRVGDGVGFDAYPLRTASDRPVPVTLSRTGRTRALPVTQHRMSQEGRELARSVAAGAALPTVEKKASLYPPVAYPEHAWAMAIDLDACIGCRACTIACQAENNIPVVGAEQVARGREMHWIRVDRYAAESPGDGSIFQPVPCMHCEDAPCEVVCPVGATVHDSEGLNVQVYNRCVGTRFCSNNCPYKVRRFNFLQYADETTETLKAMRNPDVTVRQRGVMEKCTYCVQRISRARIGAEESHRPIADGDVLTACQSACPTRAIHFGDLNDAASDVVRARASPRHYAMLDELNTRPRTTYLARVVAPKDGA